MRSVGRRDARRARSTRDVLSARVVAYAGAGLACCFRRMTYRDSLEAEWDVLVIGGGHAGVEAAVAAARLGARVGLVTSALETIGQMSCNPAIGGVAKGTVVREVDALGGVMGRATDRATVQFRMLNRGKGPAVWSPRAQCDRGLYRRAVRSELERHERVALVQGTVSALVLGDGGRRVVGVETLEGRRFGARATVVTTGTFCGGACTSARTGRSAAGVRATRRPRTSPSSSRRWGSPWVASRRDAAAHRRALGGLLGARRAGERAGGLRLPVEPLHDRAAVGWVPQLPAGRRTWRTRGRP
jgi:hypothetical protein